MSDKVNFGLDTFTRLMCVLLESLLKPKKGFNIRWRVSVGPVTFSVLTAEGVVPMTTVPIGYKAVISLAFVDALGNPSTIDGTPKWNEPSDPTKGEQTVSEDGTTAEFNPSGVLGTVQLSGEADVDLGEGVKPLKFIIDLDIQAGETTQVITNVQVVPL